jgi:hypothetical protein
MLLSKAQNIFDLLRRELMGWVVRRIQLARVRVARA